MRSFVTAYERVANRLRQSPVIATIVVTAMTIVLIGGVVLTVTAAGCGPARALGLKAIANAKHCAVSTSATARSSPSFSPFTFPTGSPASAASPTPPVSPSPTPPPPIQPVVPEASGGVPTYPTVSDASGPGGTPIGLNCRLPVYVGPPGSGGFIAFPEDTFIADPASSVTAPSPGQPSPSPQQYGQLPPSGLSYDRAHSRWLPVPMHQVSDDGSRYAFAGADGVYVVSTSGGAATELGAGRQWTVLSVGTDGVYATVPNAGGLWLLPFSGASPRQVIATGYWNAINGGAAYGSPTSAVPQGTSNTIQQLNLSTGAVKDYFTRYAMQSQVAGFDHQGTPVIYTNGPTGSEIWVGKLFLTAYLQGGPQFIGGFLPIGSPVADSHGLWFHGYYNVPGYGGAAIVLWIPGSGLYAVSGIDAQLAGGCG